jgi:cytochrome c peroxidase
MSSRAFVPVVAAAAVAAAAVLGACSHKADPLAPPLGLTKLELVLPADDPLTVDKVELGKTLFFDPRLSASGKMSCATCHPPAKAWADGERFSTKDDGKPNTRNTPSVLNVGYLKKLYWDGRSPTLEANVLAAWKNQMGGKTDEVAKALAAVPDYAAMFQKAFGAPPSEDTIKRGLAAFLRALRSGDSAYDRYQDGASDALNNDQMAGLGLFTTKGCNVCHQPPLFTDGSFHIVGAGAETDKPDPGAGAEKAQNDPKLIGAFKPPSLRNVARTAPYFHDGSVAVLRDAVKFMAGGGKESPQRDPLLKDQKLTDKEIDQLVAFLQSLSGNDPFTSPTIPH